MSVFSQSWINVLPARTDSGPTTGMIRLVRDGEGTGSAFTFPIVFNAYRVQLTEKVQFLESFNEFIHVYAFGKGVGQAQLSGHVFATQQNPVHQRFKQRLIDQYSNKFRAFKLAKDGKLAKVSGPGTNLIQGVVLDLNYSIDAQQSNVINFELRIGIVSSALGIA